MKIHSWDVFDTLIGRLCYTPNKVFDIIEKNVLTVPYNIYFKGVYYNNFFCDNTLDCHLNFFSLLYIECFHS